MSTKWNRWRPAHEVAKYQSTGNDVGVIKFAERLKVCATCRHRVSGECTRDAIFISAKARNPQEACDLWPGGNPHPATSPPLNPKLGPTCRTQLWNLAALECAVVVISHNYGRFLREALDSVLAQVKPAAEILVVDDASTDDTAAIALSYATRGVRYLGISVRNVHAARAEGLRETTAPVVCFLDADNVLPPYYLAHGLREFTTPNVGVVYCDLEWFGRRNGLTAWPAFDRGSLARSNYVDAGALIRRDALTLSGAFARSIDPRIVSDDWYLFRRLAANRWQFRKQTERLRYRLHDANAAAQHPRWMSAPRYYDTAGLAHETLTLFVALSGRLDIWRDELAPYLDRQTWPHDQVRLILCDTSGNREFSAAVRDWLRDCDYTDQRYLAMPVEEAGLSNRDRRTGDVERRVNEACAKIYNRAASAVETDYLWILEDDIIPPDDAAERLLRCFDPHTVSATGAYLSRYDPNYVVWGFDGHRATPPADRGRQRIAGSGFGCLILRRDVVAGYVFQVPPGGKWYDPAFFDQLPTDALRVIDWSVECRHLGPRH